MCVYGVKEGRGILLRAYDANVCVCMVLIRVRAHGVKEGPLSLSLSFYQHQVRRGGGWHGGGAAEDAVAKVAHEGAPGVHLVREREGEGARER